MVYVTYSYSSLFCLFIFLVYLTFVSRSLNPNAAADDRIYFRFKFPCLRLGGTTLSLSTLHVLNGPASLADE
jgi:hypothetical protein